MSQLGSTIDTSKIYKSSTNKHNYVSQSTCVCVCMCERALYRGINGYLCVRMRKKREREGGCGQKLLAVYIGPLPNYLSSLK